MTKPKCQIKPKAIKSKISTPFPLIIILLYSTTNNIGDKNYYISG